MSKHTPGPWNIFNSKIQGTWIDPIGLRVDNTRQDNWKANARLIAAAPELLEACETILAEIVEQGDHGDAVWRRMLSELIFKVKGE